jgi:alkylhydroperoxidase family enzyme
LIAPPARDALSADTVQQLESRAGDHGHFDGVRQLFAYFPAALKALDNQYDLIIGQGRLDRGLRELIFASAASARGDVYLAHAMASVAAEDGFGDTTAALDSAASAKGRSDGETRLLAWAQKMATTPYKSVEDDVEELHDAGWSDEEIVEALTVVSLSAYMSILSLSLKLAS